MITVLFATHNGGSVLQRTLESMAELLPPQGGWEIIVADNASSDNSSAILSRFEARMPLRVVAEPRRGKNVALNAALPLANGDVLVFTDDDIVVPADWLVCYRQLADEQSDFSSFGGRITPLWPVEPSPAVLKGVPLGAAFGIYPESLPRGSINAGQIWGGNMAVRSSVFALGARFS